MNGDCSGRDWRESGRSDYDLFPSPTFISIAPLYRGLSTSVKQKKQKNRECASVNLWLAELAMFWKADSMGWTSLHNCP